MILPSNEMKQNENNMKIDLLCRLLVAASLIGMIVVTSCSKSNTPSNAALASLQGYLRQPSYGQDDSGMRFLQKVLLLKTDETAGFAYLADQDPPLKLLGAAEISFVDKEWLVIRFVIYGVEAKAISVQTISGNRTLTPPMNSELSIQQKNEWEALLKKYGLTISDMEKAKSAIPVGR